MPYEIPACAGKPYRPSNGTEGGAFMEGFCFRCVKDKDFHDNDGDSCPIVARALFYNVDEPEYPPEWTHDDRGRPTCTAFERDTEAT